CFMAIGDLSLSAMYNTFATFYNKRLGSDYDMPDMFELVDNGEWTIDKIAELSKDVYQDLNLDGKTDIESDLFGYVSGFASRDTYIWAFDNPIYRYNDGELSLVLYTEKLADIYSKLTDVFTLYSGIETIPIASSVGEVEIFVEGRAMFINSTLDSALSMRNMEDDYSILPFPKWDETQKNYYTKSSGAHDALAVPITVRDLERAGTITEALCAETYKILFPAYYDLALKVKGTRDEESIKMLDMIVDSCVFDFGYLYDGWKGLAVMLYQQLTRENKNIESAYRRYERSAVKWYNSVLETFENYEG
ncbi:MAG: hypothetical protein J6S76_06465, partial [Clostridia bacterium]|nr:hypothetical protein [Clostridia bacterium]